MISATASMKGLRDTLIGFQFFAETIQESKFASSLESAPEPLFNEQKQGFNSLRYEAAMDISEGSVVMLQPPSRHDIIADEKQVIISPPAQSSASPATRDRAQNMEQPGNWYKPGWDPQFIYWELVKACCILHGYEVKQGVGIHDPRTSEIWTNPTLYELVGLITGEPRNAEPDTTQLAG